MRNFITHTYALAFGIVNTNELILFQENQWQLGLALENLSKEIVDNKIDSLVTEINKETKEVVPSDSFAKIKQRIQNLHKTLDSQLQNAEKHFFSKNFLESIKKETGTEPIKSEEISEKKVPNNDWECEKCTYWNAKNKSEKCHCC